MAWSVSSSPNTLSTQPPHIIMKFTQLLLLAACSLSMVTQSFATAATAERETPQQTGNAVSVKMAASTTLYQGTLAAMNSSGYAVTATDATGLTVIGVVDETVTNSGSAGAASVKIKRGVFKFANSATNAVDQADVGLPVYVEDNQTICDTSTYSIYAGVCVRLDSDGGWIDTRAPLPTVGTVAAAAITTAKLADGVADLVLSAPGVTVANSGSPDGNATITVQLKDAQGNSLAARGVVNVWFASSAAWAAPADLGTLTASTGVILKEDTDDALATVSTDASGTAVLVLDTASNVTVHAHASVGGLAATANASITGN
jgi:hypothetical protein